MKSYINDPGNEVPDFTIGYYRYQNEINCGEEGHPHDNIKNYNIDDVVESLIGKPTREWFTYPFSFCLPLTIANQYGFVIKAANDITLYWTGGDSHVSVQSVGYQYGDYEVQQYNTNFGSGVLTIENKFLLRTPPNVNLMVIPVPNHYIEGVYPLTGVVETDNLRRSFTFNLKVTTPHKKIYIKKGDWLASFIPVPRFYVEKFKLENLEEIYSEEIIKNEKQDMEKLLWERFNHKDNGGDIGKPNDSGRRYFKGLFPDDTPYKNHQKRIVDGIIEE
jgi:hypothetical protein